MEIRDCGRNGDQHVRLLQSPAQLFVVQFVGELSETLIKDVEGKVNEIRLKGKQAWFCMVSGEDIARLLRAYGKALISVPSAEGDALTRLSDWACPVRPESATQP